MKEKIYLIGFMGCGKSTVSRILSRRLRVKQLEMDEILESEAHKPITEIFAQDGEEAFRRQETALLKRIAAGDPAVVSCGGGAALRAENVEAMRQNGTVVLLQATPQTIYERVKNSTDRPVLNGHMNVEYIASLMAKRLPCYEAAADLVIGVDELTPEQVAEMILQQLSGFHSYWYMP